MKKEASEIVIHINKKEVSLKCILDTLFKIDKIVNDNCAYCKEHNINTDKEKLELIKKLVESVIK